MEKTLLLSVRPQGDIYSPEGKPLKTVTQAVYVGGLITDDGRVHSEITRRLREAGQSFSKLSQVWKHARGKKKDIFDICVVSKLLYSLESLCLLQADRDRVDCFYIRKLRYIWNIKPSFISRILNDYIYGISHAEKLSSQLLKDVR